MSIALKLESVSKQFRLGQLNSGTLRGDMQSWWERKSGQQADVSRAVDYIWALRDIDLEVRQGEILGVIGKNGAGKSTLLKLLSRISAPTRGRICVRGAVGSLLEVGTGFHPELTGRDNIYLNGAILGMRRRDISRKLDEIIAFANIEQFVDTPIKRYSSGMALRLAFAVASHLDADILLIDEVLAVGDMEFQKKCLSKMENVSEQGRTVVFVSHSMSAVSRLCQTGLLLDSGRAVDRGPVDEIVAGYLKLNSDADSKAYVGELNKHVAVERVVVNGNGGSANIAVDTTEDVEVKVLAESDRDLPAFRMSLGIDHDGRRVSTIMDSAGYSSLSRGTFETRYVIPARILKPGQYWLSIGADTGRAGEWMRGESVIQLIVKGRDGEVGHDDYSGFLDLSAYQPEQPRTQ